MRLGPDDWQRKLQRRQCPPRPAHTSPVSRCLSSGGAGEWSEPIVSITPDRSPSQSRSLVPVPDRWRTLKARISVRDLLGGKREIMRTCLDRQRQSLRACLPQERESNPPTTDARCGRGSDTRGINRSRVELPRVPIPRAATRYAGGSCVPAWPVCGTGGGSGTSQLGMHQQGHARLCQLRHHLAPDRRRSHWEIHRFPNGTETP